ncbi:glycosyltransferase family 4 protein [Rhizobium helianthi]|uniref:Glycosyltransferase family 4 protein n=1 Tax=Rhizobium helianthi TaxID=1132695 RepID=A0ABW4M3P3_9HYPH
MTIDAVGGVWRYAMDLAIAMKMLGTDTVFLGFGPVPDAQKRHEAERIGTLRWSEAPLDWLVSDQSELGPVAQAIAQLVEEERVDLVHLNLPSQAAELNLPVPVLVVAHSCVVTWFASVRGEDVPADWAWQKEINKAGFSAANAVVAPSRAFAHLLQQAYGPELNVSVVHNTSRVEEEALQKNAFVCAAGRWWDDGKNGPLLDTVAHRIEWPLRMIGPLSSPSGSSMKLDHADHLGELCHDETLAVMRNAGIFVSPSLYEPFGLAALEAARLQCALVLADIPVYRELWGGVALFADPRDAGSFAVAVTRLIGDPCLRQTLGKQAQAASRRYSAEAQAEAMNALYCQLAGHPLVTAAAE